MGVPTTIQHGEQLDDVLLFIGLQFLVSHEVGHYVEKHYASRTSPTGDPQIDGMVKKAENLRVQADELDADHYAIQALCDNLLDDDGRAMLTALLPPHTMYSAEQLAIMIAIGVSGVFLIHFNWDRPHKEFSASDHPPLALRHTKVIEAINAWMTVHSHKTAVITQAKYDAIMGSVGNGLPTEIRVRWTEQVDQLAAPEGQQHVTTLLQRWHSR